MLLLNSQYHTTTTTTTNQTAAVTNNYGPATENCIATTITTTKTISKNENNKTTTTTTTKTDLAKLAVVRDNLKKNVNHDASILHKNNHNDTSDNDNPIPKATIYKKISNQLLFSVTLSREFGNNLQNIIHK